MTAEALKSLNRGVGRWLTELVHPALPGEVNRGTTDIEWLEGERFLILRSRVDHPQFPDTLMVIGYTGSDRVDQSGHPSSASDDAPELTMHTFDSRGVFRVYDVRVDDRSWHFERMAEGFSQRFTITFSDDGNTLTSTSQLCQDGEHWNDDLQVTYRRRP